jgi:PAS domain S-box-containing protein
VRDERWRLAEASAGIGIWDIDPATDTVRGTAQFFRIMGLEPVDATIPMSVLRGLRFPEDRERVSQGYALAVRQKTDRYDSEYRIRRPDGEIRWIFGRGSVIRDADGRPIRYSGVDIDVTERKAAEQALAESETRLRLAIEAAGLGIWDWIPLTNEMDWSAKAKAIAGFPLDQPITYEQVRDSTHPEDLPRTSEIVKRALDPAVRGKEPYEYRLIRTDGQVRWVLAHGEARFANIDGVERAYRFTGTIQDITDRKVAEARQQASESRLRLVVEAARLGVWEYDRASDQVQSTPDLNRILGYPEDQKLDVADIRSRYFPGDQQRLRSAGEAALARGDRYFQTEYRFRRPDEEVIWLLLRAEILNQHRWQSARRARRVDGHHRAEEGRRAAQARPRRITTPGKEHAQPSWSNGQSDVPPCCRCRGSEPVYR